VLLHRPLVPLPRLEEYRNEADSATKELAAHRAASRLRAREAALAIAQAEAGEKKAELASEVGEGIEATKVIEKARLDLELARVGTEISRRIADARAREDRAELERLLGVKRSAEERVAELGESLGKLRVPAPISGTVLHPEDWLAPDRGAGADVEGVAVLSSARTIHVPFTTALRKLDRDPLRSPLAEIVLRLEEDASPHQVSAITAGCSTVVPEALLEQSRQTQRLFNIVMGCIAGISLLVGGIGIMNIMLASVRRCARPIQAPSPRFATSEEPGAAESRPRSRCRRRAPPVPVIRRRYRGDTEGRMSSAGSLVRLVGAAPSAPMT
jgi:putative ABC transport system permease protein